MPPRRRYQYGHYDDESGRCASCFEPWPCEASKGNFEAEGTALRDWEADGAQTENDRKKAEVRATLEPLIQWAEEAGLEGATADLKRYLDRTRIHFAFSMEFSEFAWMLSIVHAHGAKRPTKEEEEATQQANDEEPF